MSRVSFSLEAYPRFLLYREQKIRINVNVYMICAPTLVFARSGCRLPVAQPVRKSAFIGSTGLGRNEMAWNFSPDNVITPNAVRREHFTLAFGPFLPPSAAGGAGLEG